MVGVPERERVYFGAPTACGSTDCRAFSPLFIVGHDQTTGTMNAIIAPAADINGDGGDDLGRPDTGRRLGLDLPGRRRARATARQSGALAARPVTAAFGGSLAELAAL